MAENRIRRHWSEEDVRQLIRDELVSPFVTTHMAEVAKIQAYDALNLWHAKPALPRAWWRKLLKGHRPWA